MATSIGSRGVGAAGLLAALVVAALFSTGCTTATEAPCAATTRVDLRGVDPDDPVLPFRHPLDAFGPDTLAADFCEYRGPGRHTSHAAEDYWMPAGTPVHAMAEGVVSYSGTMGGYGWLVIVDHPAMNLYSLYGHLSPSRWATETGMAVDKGDLLGYLGDEWENGGSRERPLVTHLHLGVRSGLRSDYPGKGEWRWMAGWITPCPAELGWLQPSAVIAAQTVPEGGFAGPAGGWLERWWGDLLLVGLVSAAPMVLVVAGVRRDRPALPLAAAAAAAGLGWFAVTRHVALRWPFPAVAALGVLVAAGLLARRWSRTRSTS